MNKLLSLCSLKAGHLSDGLAGCALCLSRGCSQVAPLNLNAVLMLVQLMAHNGPYGLGDMPQDPCGVDFRGAQKDGSKTPSVLICCDPGTLCTGGPRPKADCLEKHPPSLQQSLETTREPRPAMAGCQACLRSRAQCRQDAGFDRQDHGDRDLQQALLPGGSSAVCRVAAVLFGHMHHRLNRRTGGGLRNMAHIDAGTGAVLSS